MLAPFMPGKAGGRHDVPETLQDCAVHGLRPRARAVFRRAMLILRPQAVHDETVGLGCAALLRVGAAAF